MTRIGWILFVCLFGCDRGEDGVINTSASDDDVSDNADDDASGPSDDDQSDDDGSEPATDDDTHNADDDGASDGDDDSADNCEGADGTEAGCPCYNDGCFGGLVCRSNRCVVMPDPPASDDDSSDDDSDGTCDPQACNPSQTLDQYRDYDCDGWTFAEGDCYPCNRNFHPGADELCSDSIGGQPVDNDCNGFANLDDAACTSTGDDDVVSDDDTVAGDDDTTDPGPAVGTRTGACYSNGTCNDDCSFEGETERACSMDTITCLVCASPNLCVHPTREDLRCEEPGDDDVASDDDSAPADDDVTGDDDVATVDADRDGADADHDCDDTDPAKNLRDTDRDGYTTCDGDCDDNDPDVIPEDLDGDGFNACTGARPDCNDFDASIYPGAAEDCDNGRDDDCDGLVDGISEGCEAPSGDDDTVVGDDDTDPDPGACSSGSRLTLRVFTPDRTVWEGAVFNYCVNNFGMEPVQCGHLGGTRWVEPGEVVEDAASVVYSVCAEERTTLRFNVSFYNMDLAFNGDDTIAATNEAGQPVYPIRWACEGTSLTSQVEGTYGDRAFNQTDLTALIKGGGGCDVALKISDLLPVAR